MASTRIAELAARIQLRTSDIDSYLQHNQLPSPAFDEDGPVDLNLPNGDLSAAREQVLDATLELHDLLLGPSLCLRPVYNGLSLQVIYKYDIASKVPLYGEASFADLAEKCSLSEVNIRRMLRYAMVFHHVFREPRKGFVAHTAASRRLAEDPYAGAGLGYMFDETLPALEQFHSDEPNKCGWSHYHNTDKAAWEYYALHPDKARRFTHAMSAFADGHGNSPAFLVQNYPWNTIGTGTVVDVGGSKGDIGVLLAKQFPDLGFIIQDLPEMITGASDTIPAEFKSRIQLQAHDFFTEQPVYGADVYFFRNIFHNWSDSRAILILKALVPALRQGSRLVINDYVLPEVGTMSLTKERAVRDMDLIMLTLFNAREREEADWIELFRKADPRFSVVRIWTPEGATMAIIEVLWTCADAA
ncbi:uncharacterized protein TRUGW13939_10641 [Talaromyces rugulosus]|uniref:O-methyltransferase C-terminal domain-containing protein n=1 Tax=Talaromyces rugulosus TaxID=121627 RepID=A0A7H8RCG4_TALRU|nr:uncharacterized protein TRUGW13939_10641 [Talaromyces rugulosus]QKX63471.1 hypothetical protein TRUGW13939_10641 [Talaromyces rugulosus]